MKKSLYPVLVLLGLGCLWGCAGPGQESSHDEAKAFFAAANQANFSTIRDLSPNQMDLSGYTPMLGMKYPPTREVEVLNAPPARPYQSFAVLESPAPASGAAQNNSLEDLKNQAKAIGADAIILCSRDSKSDLVRAQASGKIEATAVKYRH